MLFLNIYFGERFKLLYTQTLSLRTLHFQQKNCQISLKKISALGLKKGFSYLEFNFYALKELYWNVLGVILEKGSGSC